MVSRFVSSGDAETGSRRVVTAVPRRLEPAVDHKAARSSIAEGYRGVSLGFQHQKLAPTSVASRTRKAVRVVSAREIAGRPKCQREWWRRCVSSAPSNRSRGSGCSQPEIGRLPLMGLSPSVSGQVSPEWTSPHVKWVQTVKPVGDHRYSGVVAGVAVRESGVTAPGSRVGFTAPVEGKPRADEPKPSRFHGAAGMSTVEGIQCRGQRQPCKAGRSPSVKLAREVHVAGRPSTARTGWFTNCAP